MKKMTTRFTHWTYSVGVLIVFALGMILWGFVFDKGELILFFSDRRHWLVNYFFYGMSLLGEAYIYIVLTIFFLFYNFSKSITIGLTGIMVMANASLLKNYFMHHRPYRYFTEYIDPPVAINYIPYVELHSGYTTSFPSGHTMSAFAIYTLIALWSKRLSTRILCLSIATLVAISRVYLVQHFLKDVIAGLVVGYLIGLLMHWIFSQFQKKEILQGKIKKPV